MHVSRKHSNNWINYTNCVAKWFAKLEIHDADSRAKLAEQFYVWNVPDCVIDRANLNSLGLVEDISDMRRDGLWQASYLLGSDLLFS